MTRRSVTRRSVSLIALGFILGAFTMTAFHALAEGDAKKAPAKPVAKPAAKPAIPPSAKLPEYPPGMLMTPQSLGQPPAPPGVVPARRVLTTLRGEIVDYYCYIEKGLKGESHKACGLRCVAGDICMGLLTTDDDLYMISVNHLRAMDPLGWKSIPDPFTTCRGSMGEIMDITGYPMERKDQRIIEIMGAKKAVGPPPVVLPQFRHRSKS